MATDLTTTACPRCGFEVPLGSRFCPNCGLSLTETPRAERRIVTMLFADLTGFTELSERLDAEEVKGIVDRAFEGLAELVTLYGGRVDKIVGDEIMAVFGAPQAHEDDPERAVRCALEMQRQLATYSHQLKRDRGVTLGMRIGVNTGEVVAGLVGGVDQYSVIGDAVNAAKRIETAAQPDQVLVGERTYLATANAIEYRALPPIIVKGKAEPLAVWEAISEQALPGEHIHRLEAPIIGRDEERALLDALAGIVKRDRRAAVATILGPAGMGKSRIADEFAGRMAAHGTPVFTGRSLPYGTASPSFAVEEMVRAALEIEPGDQPGAVTARAAERIASLGLVADADRLLTFAGLKNPTAQRETGRVGPAASGAPAGRGGESLEAAGALFQALAAREDMVILVFQELHWAEDLLLDFVGTLLERGRDVPLLVLCVSRPELLERAPSWTGRPGSLVHVLEPLPRAHAAELLDALSAGRAIHPAVRESILDRAGGNPFFIEELVRLLLEKGGLPSADGPDAANAVPGTVQALVLARLDALPPGTKRAAQTAAVIGDEFWPGALEALEPDVGKEGIRGALNELIERELIEPIEHPSLPDESAYRFRQAIVRDVAYGSVPKQIRAQQHAALGAWLEKVTAESAELRSEFADLVAHHYERAARVASEVGIALPDAREKAREFLERAGDQAMGMDAAAAAADFYERAIEFARGDEDRLDLQLHLGEALVGCWRPVEAEQHLNEALENARRVGDRGAESKALRLLGDLLRMRGDIEDGRVMLDQALEIAQSLGDRLEQAEGMRSHGLSDLFQGRLESATEWFRQSLAHFRDLGDKRGEGWSLVNLGWVDLLLGRLDDSMSELEQGASIFADIGDMEGVGWCLGLRVWVLLFQGNLAEAEALQIQIDGMIAQSIRPSPRGMTSFGWGIGRVARSFIAIDRARFAEGEELGRQALDVFEESDAVWGLAMARFPLGVAQLTRLSLDEARETFELAVEAAERSGDPMVKALCTHGVAMVEAQAGNLDESERLIDMTMELTEGTGVSWISEIPAKSLKALILQERGRTAEARAVLADIKELPNGLYEESRAIGVLSEIESDEGNYAQAVVEAQRGIDHAGEDVVGKAWCLRALARAHHLNGDQAKAEKALREELELLEPTDWDAERVSIHALLAKVLDEQGRHDEAAVVHEEGRTLLGRFPPGAHIERLAAQLAK